MCLDKFPYFCMKPYKMKLIMLSIVSIISFLTCNFFSFSDQKNQNVSINQIVTDKGKVNVIKIRKNSCNYKIAKGNPTKNEFYMNSNYFAKDGSSIGEVILSGRKISDRRPSGGFFTTDGSNPKFYFGNRPNNVEFSSQTHTPLIINGHPKNNIMKQSWAKKGAARILIGENSSGDIIVTHTYKTDMTVSEFYQSIKKLGIVNGLMFDGGSSVEIGLKNGDINYHYQEVNDIFKIIGNIPSPKIFIVGNFN